MWLYLENLKRAYVSDPNGDAIRVFDLDTEAELPGERIDLAPGSEPRSLAGL
jgi:hypothetical protein